VSLADVPVAGTVVQIEQENLAEVPAMVESHFAPASCRRPSSSWCGRLQADHYRRAMVEDRMSDAPSLSGADLGISAHVAIEAADVALASSDMPEVANVIDQSRRSPCARRP